MSHMDRRQFTKLAAGAVSVGLLGCAADGPTALGRPVVEGSVDLRTRFRGQLRVFDASGIATDLQLKPSYAQAPLNRSGSRVNRGRGGKPAEAVTPVSGTLAYAVGNASTGSYRKHLSKTGSPSMDVEWSTVADGTIGRMVATIPEQGVRLERDVTFLREGDFAKLAGTTYAVYVGGRLRTQLVVNSQSQEVEASSLAVQYQKAGGDECTWAWLHYLRAGIEVSLATASCVAGPECGLVIAVALMDWAEAIHEIEVYCPPEQQA